MTVNYTTLLGLAKPVSGTESGTWGDTVNTNLTDYLDSAVAGAQIISGTQTAVTLSKTTGASLSQAGTGSTGSSQYQIIRCTGNPASLLTITVPAADKTYVVINATSTSQSVKIVGAGPTTGVTILSGKTSLVTWNGSDFVEITPAGTNGTVTSVAALTLGTTGTDVSSTVANGTTTPVITLNLPTASATNRGALSSTDWTAFNGKLSTTGGTMTGNLTLDAYTEKVATLATSGTIALNPATGTTLSCAAAGTVTFTDSLSSGQSISLLLTNGSSYTINWPAGTTWVTAAGNTAPTLSASNTLVFWKISSTLYGALVGKSA